jgi:hypothetical protein
MPKDCQYICDTYGVPAQIGRRVIVAGAPGIIEEDRGNYLGVTLDSDKPGVISNCHPTWEVKYLEMGKIRKMTRSQKRYQEYLDADWFDDSFAVWIGCG